MKNHESEEMYLETILLLKGKNPSIHAIDIAGELGYAKSSVSRAVGLLRERGYINIGDGDEITLTEKGLKKATDVYERHRVITGLFLKMGADEKLAEENACRIEHVISEELFVLLKDYVENLER